MTNTQAEYLMQKLDKIGDDVADVRERVTRLEANDELRLKSLTRIQWAIGLSVTTLIGGVPVLFLIVDRISN